MQAAAVVSASSSSSEASKGAAVSASSSSMERTSQWYVVSALSQSQASRLVHSEVSPVVGLALVFCARLTKLNASFLDRKPGVLL